MKTALLISLTLSLAITSQAASTLVPIPYSAEPSTNTLGAGDWFIVNTTNTGTGTQTTKRASVGGVLGPLLPAYGGVTTNVVLTAYGANTWLTVTNGQAPWCSSGDLLFLSPPSNQNIYWIFQGTGGQYGELAWRPQHSGVYGEFNIQSTGIISLVSPAIQHATGSPGYSQVEYYHSDSIPNPGGLTNLFGSMPLQFQATCFTNVNQSVEAGSLDPNFNFLPAFEFDASDTNGSGTWTFWGGLNAPLGSLRSAWTYKNPVLQITTGYSNHLDVCGGLTASNATVAGTVAAANLLGNVSGCTGFPQQTLTSGFTNLASGAATVLAPSVSGSSLIFLSYGSSAGNTSNTLAEVLSSRSPGVSFAVKSSNANDTNIVQWMMLPGSSPVVYDPDAASFIARAGLTSQTEMQAVNNLVINAKAHGWWTLCDAIYPMTGESSNACSANLRGTNYSVVWHGTGLSFTTNGVTSTGAADTWGDCTNLSPGSLSQYSLNSAHLFFYCGQVTYNSNNPSGNLSEAMGLANNYHQDLNLVYSGSGSTLSPAGLNNSTSYNNQNDTVNFTAAGDMRGPTIVSRTSSTAQTSWIRGIQSSVFTTAATAMDSGDFFLFADNSVNYGALLPCALNMRGASIGAGISPTVWAAMSADWDTFNAALGRKVP